MDDTKPSPNLALINKMLCLGHSPLVDGTWVPKYTDRWNPAANLNQALNMLGAIGASVAFVTDNGTRRAAQVGATRMLWAHHQRAHPRDPFVSMSIAYHDGSVAAAPLPAASSDKRCPEQVIASLITDAVEAYAATKTEPTLFIAKGD